MHRSDGRVYRGDEGNTFQRGLRAAFLVPALEWRRKGVQEGDQARRNRGPDARKNQVIENDGSVGEGWRTCPDGEFTWQATRTTSAPVLCERPSRLVQPLCFALGECPSEV